MPTTLDLRRGVASLSRLAAADLAVAWRDAESPQQAEAFLRDTLPSLVDLYGAAAATFAADWYDDLRDEREIPGRFTAIPADIGETGTQALVGWALAEATDLSAFRTLIEGGTQRRIANFARATVTGSAIADPRADGWQRVGDGDSCAFCRMLIGRGAVYSEAGADFASHDKCGCSAVPAFNGQPRPVKPFEPSSRNITDADRARVREWIASH